MHYVILCYFLHCKQSFCGPPIRSVFGVHICNFPNKSRKGQFAKKEVRALLVLADLPECHSPWPVPVRFGRAFNAIVASRTLSRTWTRRRARVRAAASAGPCFLICPWHASLWEVSQYLSIEQNRNPFGVGQLACPAMLLHSYAWQIQLRFTFPARPLCTPPAKPTLCSRRSGGKKDDRLGA